MAGTDDASQELANLYGGRETQQATYTYLRMEMPLNKRWNTSLSWSPGGRLRGAGLLESFDPRMPDRALDSGVTVRFNGYQQAREEVRFGLSGLTC